MVTGVAVGDGNEEQGWLSDGCCWWWLGVADGGQSSLSMVVKDEGKIVIYVIQHK